MALLPETAHNGASRLSIVVAVPADALSVLLLALWVRRQPSIISALEMSRQVIQKFPYCCSYLESAAVSGV